jgi:DDE_Tnp_1-associated
MAANLIEALSQVKDFRAARGQRYPLWLVLLLVIMGTISGCTGYGALEEFACRHHQALVERLSVPSRRWPSDSTFRRIMMNIDFEELARVFNQWAKNYVPLEQSQWLAVDGKSIKGTVNNYDNAYQNFVCVVSVFSSNQGLTVGLRQFDNKNTSEIAVVQALLAALDLTGVVLTFDALHCQKKLSS